MADEQTTQAPVPAPTTSNDDIEKYKTIAAVSYILFFIPLLMEGAKESKFALFHANQSLILLIVAIAGNVILGIIPVVGWMIAPLFGIAVFVLWVMGLLNALNGKMQPLPILGGFNIHILDK